MGVMHGGTLVLRISSQKVIVVKQETIKRAWIPWMFSLIQDLLGLLLWRKEMDWLGLLIFILKEVINIEGGFKAPC